MTPRAELRRVLGMVYLALLKRDLEQPILEQWIYVSDVIHTHQDVLVKAYYLCLDQREHLLATRIALRKDYPREELTEIGITLDDQTKVDQLEVADLIIGIRNIVYRYLSDPECYLFNKEGQFEMVALERPIQFYIHFNQFETDNIKFQALFLIFALETCCANHLTLSIDYEFTDGVTKMIQACFEHPHDDRSITFMIDPKDIPEEMMTAWIKTIMCNPHLLKIFHGADAKDIPYTYRTMFQNNEQYIKQFTATLLDTRYLCDYYKANTTQITNKRCSVYDVDPEGSGIFFFGLISEERQQHLGEVLVSMTHHRQITWNVRNMPGPQIEYGQYDVLFLKQFYRRIVQTGLTSVPESKRLAERYIYQHILPEISRWVLLESTDVTDLVRICDLETKDYNNYHVKGSPALKLIDIHKEITVGIVIQSPDLVLDRLLTTPHFRKKTDFVLKRIVYALCTQRNNVLHLMVNRGLPWRLKMDNSLIHQYFRASAFRSLEMMFQSIEQLLQARLDEWIHRKVVSQSR